MTVGGGPEIRVSWIVVSHESAQDLGVFLPTLVPALARLAAKGFASELIVVDNASTDGSPEVVLEHVPDALVLRAPGNLGYGQAIDLAARHARGEWLAVGNADLSVPAAGLDELAATLTRQAADVALVGPAIRDHEQRKSPSVGAFPTLFSLLTGLARSCERRKYLALEQHLAGDVDWVTGACFFLRARALAAVGGFDEAFFLYYEDVDLARRLHDLGLRRVYAPELEVLHLSPHHHRPPQERIEGYVRASRRAYFERHRPAWERWLLGLLCRVEPVLRRSRQAAPEPAGTPVVAPVPDALPAAASVPRPVPVPALAMPGARLVTGHRRAGRLSGGQAARFVRPVAAGKLLGGAERRSRPSVAAGQVQQAGAAQLAEVGLEDGRARLDATRPAPVQPAAASGTASQALPPSEVCEPARPVAMDTRGANGHGRPASRVNGVTTTAVARERDT